MAIDYDGAFKVVIQRPWLDLPEMARNTAESSERYGQLPMDAPDAHALHDAFKYQRGHADVFGEVYKKSRHVPPRKGERLRVVDIGAGAATVAVALGEALGRSRCQRIDYLAFDPSPMMRSLGERILDHLDADFKSAKYIESLDEVEVTKGDRLLFTFSYVSHQETVAPADIDRWASLIKQAVDDVDRAVELIYTTAANIYSLESKLPGLGQRLDQVGIRRRADDVNVQVRRRFPESSSRDGRVQWKQDTDLWKVQAEYWVLRA